MCNGTQAAQVERMIHERTTAAKKRVRVYPAPSNAVRCYRAVNSESEIAHWTRLARSFGWKLVGINRVKHYVPARPTSLSLELQFARPRGMRFAREPKWWTSS
jgi:hypothetical protein